MYRLAIRDATLALADKPLPSDTQILRNPQIVRNLGTLKFLRLTVLWLSATQRMEGAENFGLEPRDPQIPKIVMALAMQHNVFNSCCDPSVSYPVFSETVMFKPK